MKRGSLRRARNTCGYVPQSAIPTSYSKLRARNRARTPDQTPCSDGRRCESDNSAWEETLHTFLPEHRPAAECFATSPFHLCHPNREVPRRVSAATPNRKCARTKRGSIG